MSAFFSRKLSLLLLLCSYCIASVIVISLHYALDGPKLGRVYDALLSFRPPPAVSAEILLIETEEIVEPGDVFSVLMALSEMDASDLLVEVAVLGSGSSLAESGTEFSYRINDEFGLLEKNIRSLFEAIRLGMVPPEESAGYVDSLVELAERGRDRLNSVIVRQDEAGSLRAAQAAAVFGKVITAEDLRAQPGGGIPEVFHRYSRPQPGGDRVLRRMAPVLPGENGEVEHIVYQALKPRWIRPEIELKEAGKALAYRVLRQGEEAEYHFPLDRDGNILFEKPAGGAGFHRLALDRFREYDNTDRALARMLKEAEALGVYAETLPERMPLMLYDFADILKEELLKAPSAEYRRMWINARLDYLAGLDEFLYGPAEMSLVNGYEELIALEDITDEGIAKIQGLRDELIRAFVSMREKHRQLVELRGGLAEVIASGFCIMGPAPSVPGAEIPESSAFLANALLTGNSITPGQSRYVIFWPLLASFVLLFCIRALRPLWLLAAGSAAGLAFGAAFGAAFVFSGYWIDPLIPAAACFGGTAFLAAAGFSIGYRREFRFRLAQAPFVNGEALKLLVKAGRPLPSETLCAHAAIIAVKNNALPGRENSEKPSDAALAAAEFRRVFSQCFRQEGAMVLGFESDTALACFGSPHERIWQEKIKNGLRYAGSPEDRGGIQPAEKAAGCVRELQGDPRFSACCFGLESGECAFTWSSETGWTASGRPVIHARIFASLALRYHVKSVIGDKAKSEAGLEAGKLAALAGENFYELP